MKQLKRFLENFFQLICDDKISVYAAQVSFFVTISAIPIVMLIVPLI